MRSIRICGLSLLLVAFTACTRSPADRLKAELQSVSSWSATSRMVGEAWLKGAVPYAYAAETLRAAQETLSEEIRTLQGEKPEGGTLELHNSVLERARGIEQVIGEMRASIEKRDSQSLSHLLKQLEAEEQATKALMQTGGPKP